MSFLKKLFGVLAPDPKPEETPHQGHLIALGAKCAQMVAERGISHAKLIREHVLWSANDGGYRIISWGNGVQLKWPGDIQTHVEHLKTLHDEIGHAATAAFRLGYVYQLGPLGELVFLGVRSGTPLPELQTLPAAVTRMWEPPKAGDLGESAILTSERVGVEQENGIRARMERDLSRAKMSFLRVLIHGIAEQNAGVAGLSLFNLATVHGDELSWLRAAGLVHLALTLTKGNDEVQKHAMPYYALAREQVSGENHARLMALFSDGPDSTIASNLWSIADLDLTARIEIPARPCTVTS